MIRVGIIITDVITRFVIVNRCPKLNLRTNYLDILIEKLNLLKQLQF